MDEFLDHVDEGIETIDFFKEGLRVSVVLIQEVARENVDKQLIEIDSFKHVAIREDVKVVTDGFFFVEEDPLEEDIAVLVGV